VKLTFLGTGTSVGVPMIGCRCAVCTSADPRNRRRRSSVQVCADGKSLIVDTPPDFREQVLAHGVERVDAVLFTHSHADHVFGFDDIRRFNTLQRASIPVYGSPETVADLRRVFNYVGAATTPGDYRPRAEFREVTGPFALGALDIAPLTVEHGRKHTVGYLFRHAGRSLGYIPDCSRIPAAAMRALRGVDIMVLDALRFHPHGTHLTVEQSLACLAQIGAGRSFLTHLAHDVEYAALQAELPPGMFLAYDGLALEW